MRFRSKLLVFLAAGLLHTPALFAQKVYDTSSARVTVLDENTLLVDRKFYSASGIDGAIFSTSILSKPGVDNRLSTLRFSMLSFGVNLHYDFSHTFGIFSGVGIKNIGFIEKFKAADSTAKHRVYTIGIPLAFKIGDLKKRKFFFAGGGADLALNYREKGFIRRGNKEKFNEWFSERTPLIMPYIFAGISFDPGLTLKMQYYPQNFMNDTFVDPVTGLQPYKGYKVRLLQLTLGIDIHYNVLPKEVKWRKQNNVI